ncbi:MFS transporter [Actinomadura macrotermitis]|uniref:MFS transporter n=1 Tax=Actinomadura macrotermitis TaxID=2585200 RepID=A0A7K0C1L0_9ACTN|nr:MFS transporter [Actinomadura macrotermitis]MQY07353.1 hypothetical protein [Actinomadura macrotermitis]
MWSSPYRPVLAHPRFRRILPALAVSALGDGMSLVAVTWLALQLAPRSHHGTWVAVAVAAYSLPAVAGAVLFAPFLRGRGGARLAGWDAALRGAALGAIPVAYAFDVLGIGLYTVLLAVSSLLRSWGSAGRYTVIAELLPGEQHLPANAVLTVLTEAATVIGPPLAGLLIAWWGGAAVIAIDAATFAVMAATYLLAVPRTGPAKDAVAERAAGALAVIRRDGELAGLLALTFGFFLLFGPVMVALPLHVTEDLHGSATLLGLYYTAFGLGAAGGGLAAGHMRRRRLWPTIIALVAGFGGAMVPMGLAVPVSVSLLSFSLAGLAWGPYMGLSIALFQRRASGEALASVLAANSTVGTLSLPLGTMLGGVAVGAVGARETMLGCALLTIALGATAALGLRGAGLRSR